MLPKFCGFVRLTVMTLADGGGAEEDEAEGAGSAGREGNEADGSGIAHEWAAPSLPCVGLPSLKKFLFDVVTCFHAFCLFSRPSEEGPPSVEALTVQRPPHTSPPSAPPSRRSASCSRSRSP
jgi:hypothetical protein